MSDAVARARRVLWNASEGRLRAPWRLGLTGILLLGLVEGLALLAVGAASLGNWLEPTLRAAWAILVAAVALLATVLGVLALVRLVDRRPLSGLGLVDAKPFRREVTVGLAVGAGMAIVVVGLAAVLGLATVTGAFTGWTGTFALTARHPALNAAFWLVVFAGVGVLEEVLLRGYLLVNVAEGVRGWTGDASRAVVVGVVASSGIAGALHLTAPDLASVGLATAVVGGLVLATAMAVTGRLALSIGVHVAWTATLGVGFGLPVGGIDTGAAVLAVDLSGPAFVTGGAFGPTGGLLGVAGWAAGLAALAWWLGRLPGGLGVVPRLADPDRGTSQAGERLDGHTD